MAALAVAAGFGMGLDDPLEPGLDIPRWISCRFYASADVPACSADGISIRRHVSLHRLGQSSFPQLAIILGVSQGATRTNIQMACFF